MARRKRPRLKAPGSKRGGRRGGRKGGRKGKGPRPQPPPRPSPQTTGQAIAAGTTPQFAGGIPRPTPPPAAAPTAPTGPSLASVISGGGQAFANLQSLGTQVQQTGFDPNQAQQQIIQQAQQPGFIAPGAQPTPAGPKPAPPGFINNPIFNPATGAGGDEFISVADAATILQTNPGFFGGGGGATTQPTAPGQPSPIAAPTQPTGIDGFLQGQGAGGFNNLLGFQQDRDFSQALPFGLEQQAISLFNEQQQSGSFPSDRPPTIEQARRSVSLFSSGQGGGFFGQGLSGGQQAQFGGQPGQFGFQGQPSNVQQAGAQAPQAFADFQARTTPTGGVAPPPTGTGFAQAAQPGGPGAAPQLESTLRAQTISPPVPEILGQTGDVLKGQPDFLNPTTLTIGDVTVEIPAFPTDFDRNAFGGSRFGTELKIEKLLAQFGENAAAFGLPPELLDQFNFTDVKPGKRGTNVKVLQDFGRLKGNFGKKQEGKDNANAAVEALNAFFQAQTGPEGKVTRDGIPLQAKLIKVKNGFSIGFVGNPGAFDPSVRVTAEGAVDGGGELPGGGPGGVGTPLAPDAPGTDQPPLFGQDDFRPAGTGTPEGALATGFGSLQERNQFVQNVLNNLERPVIQNQIERATTFSQTQSELQAAIKGFRTESPGAKAQRDNAVEGFMNKNLRTLDRQLGRNLRQKLNQLRGSGFASSNLATQALEETALRTYQQGIDDLTDRSDLLSLQIQEQQSNQRAREVAGLSGIQESRFPTNIPAVQFPPTGTFAPPPTFQDKLQAIKLAYFMATDIPGRSREERLKLFESIMNNTTQVIDQSGAGGFGQIAGGLAGFFSGGLF